MNGCWKRQTVLDMEGTMLGSNYAEACSLAIFSFHTIKRDGQDVMTRLAVNHQLKSRLINVEQ